MGYWKEKAKYQEEQINKLQSLNAGTKQVPMYIISHCSWCGSPLKEVNKPIICQGKHGLFSMKGRNLCNECAKKCQKCNRYFCLEHIKDHKCIK